MSGGRASWLLAGSLLASCGAFACSSVGVEPGGGGAGGATTSGFGGSGGETGACSCAPGIHQSRILLLSDDGSIWSFDPASSAFEHVRDNPCGIESPFSMAVDASGLAWMLDADSEGLFTLDVNGGGACGDTGYEPGPLQGEFGLFGMAFVARAEGDRCADLFAHSYSGSGPFGEGPGSGALGKLDAVSLRFEQLAAIDYDGGELAGTGDGRLFAFAGVDPVKLVEYDPSTGLEIATIALDGFSKTQASAFSVFGGDVYFFTEATPPACGPCLDQTCPGAHEACLASPACAEALACVLAGGEPDSDECGGGLDEQLATCLQSCSRECLLEPAQRVSQVARLDLSDPGAGVERIVAAGPIRVVGAGTSICAPVVPR